MHFFLYCTLYIRSGSSEKVKLFRENFAFFANFSFADKFAFFAFRLLSKIAKIFDFSPNFVFVCFSGKKRKFCTKIRKRNYLLWYNKTNTWTIVGANWKIGVLGSRPIFRVKVDSKKLRTITNILFSFTRTTIPNFKLFFQLKLFIGVIFFKTLDRFQDNVRFSIFKHILNLKHCHVFETKPTSPFWV